MIDVKDIRIFIDDSYRVDMESTMTEDAEFIDDGSLPIVCLYTNGFVISSIEKPCGEYTYGGYTVSYDVDFTSIDYTGIHFESIHAFIPNRYSKNVVFV